MKILFLVSVLFSSAAQAVSLPEAFNEISRQDKGPFGLNMLQGTGARVSVNSGKAPKNFLFQAAYRNEAARAIARDHGFYVANLFTTNYYELMGEYVFGDALSDHELDHNGLLAKGSAAMPKAALMVQHWVLEKHYVEHFQATKLSRSFKLRGISGSEFEQVYANHFFNFYLSSINGDFQYLPAFQLVNLSPIVNSASLQRARDLITTSYDYFLLNYGKASPMVSALYKLRNAIHNQLSRDVIKQIDAFLDKFPSYKLDGHTSLYEIRKILVNYYSFGPEKISAQAKKLGYGAVAAAADQIGKRGPNANNLLDLSRAAADLRTQISNSQVVAYEKRAVTLALIASVSQFLNRNLDELKDVNNALVAEAAVNTVYLEGFLIKDNWDFFLSEIATGASLAPLLGDLLEITSAGEGSTLYEAFAPAYSQWVSIEPKMQYFMDNTIKSSALTTVANIAQKMGR